MKPRGVSRRIARHVEGGKPRRRRASRASSARTCATDPLKSLSVTAPVTRSMTLVDERVEPFAQRREPLAEVHELGVAQRQPFLLVRGVAVERDRLQLAQRRDEDRAARRLVDAARLDARRGGSRRRRRGRRRAGPRSRSAPAMSADRTSGACRRARRGARPRSRSCTRSASSGASAGSAVSLNIAASGSRAGSSSGPPSCERCHRLRSREYRSLLRAGTGMPRRGGVVDRILARDDRPTRARARSRRARAPAPGRPARSGPGRCPCPCSRAPARRSRSRRATSTCCVRSAGARWPCRAGTRARRSLPRAATGKR